MTFLTQTAKQVPTQLSQVRNHILKRGTITSWDAISHYRITRLSEYIRILREEGMDIKTEWETSNGKRYGRYILNVENN